MTPNIVALLPPTIYDHSLSPWLSSDIISLIRKRDFLKKGAIDTKEADDWNKYKRARNTVINEIKIRKLNYYKEACFTSKKDPSKLWSTINEVCSRKPKSTNVKIWK